MFVYACYSRSSLPICKYGKMIICKVNLSNYTPPSRISINNWNLFAKVLDVRCTQRHFRLRSPGWHSHRPASKIPNLFKKSHRPRHWRTRPMKLSQYERFYGRLCMHATMQLLSVAWKHFHRTIKLNLSVETSQVSCLSFSTSSRWLSRRQDGMFANLESFSTSSMSFIRLCFTKLKLLLLAIEIKGGDEGNDSKISINPRGVKILANTQGFFIAQSADEVKR